MQNRTFSTFQPPLGCGNARDMENQRFTTSLWKTLRVYHIPTTASILYYSCVKIYADLLRKNIRLLTIASGPSPRAATGRLSHKQPFKFQKKCVCWIF